MREAIVDYYRCPEDAVNLQVAGRLSDDPGYFSLGPATVCYGNSSRGHRSKEVTDSLYDVLPDVSVDGGTVRLPFDADEIIGNLRYERYARNGHGRRTGLGDSAIIRHLYYRFRPLLPVPIRKHLQRMRLNDWHAIPFPSWPTDRTVERVLERLLALSMKAQGIRSVPFVWFWPHGATSCAIMTHDVEELAGRKFCSKVMDLDDSAGIKSSFQLVPEGRYAIPDELVQEMRGRGFEINIHDLNHDGQLFSSYGEFLRRAGRINEYRKKYHARGFRSGALYRNQAWYGALEFSYDMSVPSVGHLDPQRGGCCSLMPFFIGKVLELPVTTIQDYTLFHIWNEYSIGLWKEQLNSIVEQHGLASFIVHPDYILERRARSIYCALIEHLAQVREKRGTWIALPGEVDRWWRERGQMSVVRDGGRWRIEGRGKERARLAFATLDDGELVFTQEA